MAPVQSKIMETTKSEASIEAGRKTKSSRQLLGAGYHKNISSTHLPKRHAGMQTLQGVKPMGSYQRDSITEGGQERYPCYYREWLECLETFTTIEKATNHSKLHLHTVAECVHDCPGYEEDNTHANPLQWHFYMPARQSSADKDKNSRKI